MVFLLAQGSRTPATKPPPGAWLTTGLPITTGLTNAYLLQEAGGLTLVNMANPTQPMAVTNPPQGWRRTTLGPALNITTGAGGAVARTAAGVSLSGAQITLEVWCVADVFNTTASDAFISALINLDTVTTSANYAELRFGSDGTLAHNNIATLALNVGGTVRSCVGVVAALGVPQHLVGTYDGAVIRIYQQGVQTGSFATSGAVNASGQPLTLGHDLVQGLTRGLTGAIILARTWSRALGAAEVQDLYRDPYAMLAAPRSLLLGAFSAPATPGGTGIARLNVGRRPRGPGQVAHWP